MSFFSPSPTAPTPLDPSTFRARAIALFDWIRGTMIDEMETLNTEVKAAAAALTLNSVNDSSVTSNTIGTGTKTFTVSPSKSYVAGMWLSIVDSAAPTTNSMIGQVSSYGGTTLVVFVPANGVYGSGTKTDWTISLASAPSSQVSGAMLPVISAASLAAGRTALEVPSSVAVTAEIAAAVAAVPVSKQIQTITAVPTANTLVVSSDATSLYFRSATQGSGVVTSVAVSALTLTVPSGATLGTISAKEATLQYGVLLNGSTPEPFIYNVSHGNNVLNEEGLISTTALSAASDSEDGIYSTTARTNVPYRILGSITLTQATAGTWATSPTKIQGVGGLALLKNAKYVYTAETGNRVLGTTYYNIWGRTIWVLVSGSSVLGSVSATGSVDGTARIVSGGYDGNGGQCAPSITFPVPEGSSYSVSMVGSAISNWQEYR